MNIQTKFLPIEAHHVGQRIDNFLITHLKGLPKSRLYRALRSGEVRVNKKRVAENYRLVEGDILRIPPLRLSAPKPISTPSIQHLNLLKTAVVYEDKDIIILNKPSGVAAHGGSGIQFGVIETLRFLYPQAKYLELVHRLDRDTTGCLMVAKKPSVLKALQKMLLEGQIEKTYLLWVEGAWQGGKQRVQAALQKNTLQSGERVVKVTDTGKPSETLFTPLKVGAQLSLLQARPLTGRTHQIRVHAAHLGYPILGDDKYGRRSALRPAHLMLHAASLRFIMPTTGELMAVCACLDEGFLKAAGVSSPRSQV
ncbi:MAG: RluA family pseudouridine synthase [Gammaproteobacteria bacterium]